VLEEEWKHLMEESFLLKHYGHLSLNEQFSMPAEERHWWLKRLDDENKKINKQGAAEAAPSGKLPESPGAPPV
jgi:hypothetical protein